jgi:hypothetical protein
LVPTFPWHQGRPGVIGNFAELIGGSYFDFTDWSEG